MVQFAGKFFGFYSFFWLGKGVRVESEGILEVAWKSTLKVPLRSTFKVLQFLKLSISKSRREF